jgi:hypothetical protein
MRRTEARGGAHRLRQMTARFGRNPLSLVTGGGQEVDRGGVGRAHAAGEEESKGGNGGGRGGDGSHFKPVRGGGGWPAGW